MKGYKSKREEFEDVWLPLALQCGMTYVEFWKSCPHVINIMLKNRNQENIRADELMHAFGFYIQSAVMNAIGTSFGGSKHKNSYPKEPMFKKYYEEAFMTEEEILERDMLKAIAAEEAWIAHDKQKGLRETQIL